MNGLKLVEKVLVDSLVVADNRRTDMGDLPALARSIKIYGLLNPILVGPDGKTVISGRRRLAACKKAEILRISVYVAEDLKSALDRMYVERDENTCRMDPCPSDAVEFARTLKALEEKKGKARQQAAAVATNVALGRIEDDPGKFPELSIGTPGDSRDKIAAAAGMSARTLAKAEEVVKAAEEDPATFQPIKEEMDRTKKVDPANQKVRAIKAGKNLDKQPDPVAAIRKAITKVISMVEKAKSDTADLDTCLANLEGALESLVEPV